MFSVINEFLNKNFFLWENKTLIFFYFLFFCVEQLNFTRINELSDIRANDCEIKSLYSSLASFNNKKIGTRLYKLPQDINNLVILIKTRL